MAATMINILRQDYNSGGTAQYNGWEPNVISGALASSFTSIIGMDGTTTDKSAYIPADFKDHKTVFVFNNSYGAAKTVTFKAGTNGMGCKDLEVSVPDGLSMIWLDSARFVDKETGLIKVVTAVTADSTKALGVVGYEMR